MTVDHQKWLDSPLPDMVIAQRGWRLIIQFFILESPCFGLSYRRNKYIKQWEPAPWVGNHSLKVALNQTLFGSKNKDNLITVDSKAKLPSAIEKCGLGDDWDQSLDNQGAAFVRYTSKGNTSKYMSFFYHLRNALAHGRFGLQKDTRGHWVLLFEDGAPKNKTQEFELTARGIILLSSLVKAVDMIKKGPAAKPDFEEKILDAIRAGINTKKKIREELDISDKDWRTYSQVLRKEGKISCKQQIWVCVNETL